MAGSSLDAVRVKNLRQELPALELELKTLAKHCALLNESAASWQQLPRALLDTQIELAGRATKLLERLARLDAEARTLRARGGGAPPQRITPRQPQRFQTTADLSASVKRAKRAAAEFDRSFKSFGATVSSMMNDPLRAAELADPVTPLAKMIGDVGTIADIVLGIVEWAKRKR